jgi:hypothetical protein
MVDVTREKTNEGPINVWVEVRIEPPVVAVVDEDNTGSKSVPQPYLYADFSSLLNISLRCSLVHVEVQPLGAGMTLFLLPARAASMTVEARPRQHAEIRKIIPTHGVCE